MSENIEPLEYNFHGETLLEKMRYEQQPEIRFTPKNGETYFEYEREDGSRFLSIIGWDEWNLDNYKLEFIQRVVWNE